MLDFLKDMKGKKRWVLLLIGLVAGVVLIVLGNGDYIKAADDEPAAENSDREELETYRKETEERVKELCESVRGVGNVRVAVTLSSGYTALYATEEKGNATDYVVLGSGSGASGLYLSCLPPEVEGIGVVCTGGGDTKVKQEVISLLGAAFHLPSNRIYVAEGK